MIWDLDKSTWKHILSNQGKLAQNKIMQLKNTYKKQSMLWGSSYFKEEQQRLWKE